MGDKLKPAEGALLGPAVWCVPDPTICHWQSGGTYYLNLKLTKKMRKQARKALDDGKKVRRGLTGAIHSRAGSHRIAVRCGWR